MNINEEQKRQMLKAVSSGDHQRAKKIVRAKNKSGFLIMHKCQGHNVKQADITLKIYNEGARGIPYDYDPANPPDTDGLEPIRIYTLEEVIELCQQNYKQGYVLFNDDNISPEGKPKVLIKNVD
jgi:hypothetical protein